MRNSRLIKAAKKGDLALLQTALSEKADPNATNWQGWTALMCAAHGGHTEAGRMLLESGADVNGMDSDDGSSALWMASQNGHTEFIEMLLENGADVNGKRSSDGMTALMAAAMLGQAEIVRLLLEHGADIDAREFDNGMTALMGAAQEGHAEIVGLLLEKGADVSIATNDGEWSALQAAKENGETEIVRLLEKAEAENHGTAGEESEISNVSERDGQLESWTRDYRVVFKKIIPFLIMAILVTGVGLWVKVPHLAGIGILTLVIPLVVWFRFKVIIRDGKIESTGFLATKSIKLADVIHAKRLEGSRFYGPQTYEFHTPYDNLRINFALFPKECKNEIMEEMGELISRARRKSRRRSF